MRKVILTAALIIVCAAMTFLILVPAGPAKALSSDEEFVIDGGILRAYNGKGETCEIPSTVYMIGPGAFSGSDISYITIPDTVTTVGTQAFYECPKLSRVTIEEGVETLGMSAFANCPKLHLVNIPSTVTDIQPGIFAGCPSLSNIALSPGNQDYFFNDGVLYNKESTELVQYLAGRPSTWFDIPFTVKKIDRYSFWGCTLLTNVRISNNVPEIPDHAFSNCIGLTTIYLPESVKRIGSYGFSDCVNLYYVAMERKNVNIAPTAFSGCDKHLSTDNGITEKAAKENAKKAPEKNDEDKEEADQNETDEDKDKEDEKDNEAGEDASDDNTVSENDSSDAVKNDSSESKDKSDSDDSGKKDKKSSSKKKSSSSALEHVIRTKSGYSYTKLPSTPEPISSSDDSEELIGQTKISGGNALIIPVNRGRSH